MPDEFPGRCWPSCEAWRRPSWRAAPTCATLPLLTIDPVDARDHDDAVHAAPDTDPRKPGGLVVHVAIADVAYYVRPGSRLDREAQMRGNSVYFPDRVVPMLPEKISNDLCSLREGEDRPCLAVRMMFDAQGNKRRPHVPSRRDALGGEAELPGGAGGHRRAAERQGRAAAGALRSSRCGRPMRHSRLRATGASRWISTCPSARSCSTRRAASSASSRRSGWRPTA